jgi:hypothetical protein
MAVRRESYQFSASGLQNLVDEQEYSFHQLGVLLALTRYLEPRTNRLVDESETYLSSLSPADIGIRLGLRPDRMTMYAQPFVEAGILRAESGQGKDLDAFYLDPRIVRRSSGTTSTRKPVPPSLRFAVLERDGFKCKYCGRDASDGIKLTVDHINPAVLGGDDSMDNLIAACNECNAGKSAKKVFLQDT